jgi:hypothetical protein
MEYSARLALGLYRVIIGAVALFAVIAIVLFVCYAMFAGAKYDVPAALSAPAFRAPHAEASRDGIDAPFRELRARATGVDTIAMAYNTSLSDIARRVPNRAIDAADAKRTSDVIYDPAHDRWRASTAESKATDARPAFNPDVTMLSL